MKDSDRTFWRLQWAGWLAFAVTMAVSRVGRFPLPYMIASKLVMALLGVTFTSWILRPLYRRWLPGDASLTRVITVAALASYAVAVLWTGAHGAIDIPVQRALLGHDAEPSFWALFGGTLYDAFILLSWSVLYVGIKHQRALQAERERALKAEAAATQARLDALKWQLNPHFLFNALNAISTLVVENRSTQAAAMIARLGDLLRSTLERQAGQDLPLSAELELVRQYLDIEQLRFGDRLTIETAVDADAWNARVPVMLLQPIVENAIRHAVAPRERGGRILLGARRDGGQLELRVEDDGPGYAPGNGNGPGIGLANVRERLLHIYGSGQTLELDRGDLGGLRVRIRVPYRE